MAAEVWRLEPESELRFEVDVESTLAVTLKSGSVELLGIELAVNREYLFTGEKLVLFTWHGATLETRGKADVIYKTAPGETPMVAYVNTHAQLEARRDAALRALNAQNMASSADSASAGGDGSIDRARVRGPRVMLVGPTDSGKSSVGSILLSYAVRLGRTPTFVELDVGLGAVTVPGARLKRSERLCTLGVFLREERAGSVWGSANLWRATRRHAP
jgi:polyribonucleotide 5'-hydroxyl-kinase